MQLGVLVENVCLDQVSVTITSSLNKVGLLDKYYDVILFYLEKTAKMIPPNFALMDAVEIRGFFSPVISTNLKTSEILLNSISPSKKFFYVWDFEWIYSSYDYEYLLNIYRNPNLHLIARSKDHFDVLKRYWKEPISIIEHFNHEEITKLINK